MPDRSRCAARYGILTLFAALTVIVCALPVALAQKKTEPKMLAGRTIIGDTPWNPSGLINEKIIYGDDDRIDVYQETDPLRHRLSDATVGLYQDWQISDNGNGTFDIAAFAYSQLGLPPCPGEAFASQPVAAFCSGFLVGDDLIVTAGHCYFPSDLSSTRFVFGFEMADVATPILTVDENRVYQGVEILGRDFTDGTRLDDWAVIRLDRPVTAPGARPLEIRHTGTIALNTPLGVIGHPSGLPQKLTFGPNARVLENFNAGFFSANVDTYGGNSGSPVFDANTGVVEGILVRGIANEFEDQGGCFASVVLPEDIPGEDVTRSTIFEHLIPPLVAEKGSVTLDQTHYGCEDTILVSVSDSNIPGAASVVLTTSSGDSETITLVEIGSSSLFEGSIDVAAGGVNTENGTLNVLDGDTVTATYSDDDDGTGEAVVVEVSAEIDCTAPEISDVSIASISVSNATVNFSTNENAIPTVRYGTSCGDLSSTVTGALPGTSHSVSLTGLQLGTTYFLEVEVVDTADNISRDNNGNQCYSFTTTSKTVYFAERFSGVRDLNNLTITLIPNNSFDEYSICSTPAEDYPTDPNGGTVLALGDDDSRIVSLADHELVSLYGEEFSSYYVGSNGYITFDGPDVEFNQNPGTHFSALRISGLFADLDPSEGGTVSHKQLSDRAVVTYDNVPEWDFGGSNNFQIEMFFDGTIRITQLYVRAPFAMVGISEGFGTPNNYVSTDLSEASVCPLDGGIVTTTDIDGFFEVGQTLVLIAPQSPNGEYQWFVENTPILGETGRTITFENIRNDIDGSYTVTWNDGAKVLFKTPPFVVGVIPAGMLPLSNTLGIAILAVLSFGIGVALLCRHNATM